MRIEILVDGSVEPQIYPIDKPKLSIGSGETCDIVISSDNISRKHAIIIAEGDAYYVVDQGSTNGTYINEERLVPGRRTEFTSFFPVRLGDQVLITLLSDDDPGVSDSEPLIPLYPKDEPAAPSRSRGTEESTKMISLSDLKKAKTSDLQAKRKEVIKKKVSPAKAPPKKSKRTQENQRFKMILLTSVVVVGLAAYYNIKSKEDERAVATMNQVVTEDPVSNSKQDAEKVTNPAPVSTNPDDVRLIPDEQLIARERYLQLLADAKCITDIEKYFCEKIPGANDGRYGAVQIGTTIHIMIDGDPYIKEARGIVVHPPADAEGKYPPEIYEPYNKTVMNTALALFFMKGFPADMDWERIKDLKISVGIFETWEGQTYIKMIGAGYSDRIKRYKEVAVPENINNVKSIGDNALLFTKDYYKTY